MIVSIQEIIHKFEEGAWARYVKVASLVIIFGALAVLYDVRAFRNMSAPDAMDAAQIGRNISEGKGFTTLFVRPLSMYVLQTHRKDHSTELKTDHPDLANAPLYPYLLAGLMKAKVVPRDQDTTEVKGFKRYKPDLYIAICNQVLLLVAGLMLYGLATRLFDKPVGWLSVLVFVGSELYWRFSTSGLSTILLIIVMLGVVWCLTVLEGWGRAGRSLWQLTLLAVVTGLLVGVGGLTRYSFGWLMVPVLIFLLVFFGGNRVVLALAALGAFLLVMAPWVGRNLVVSGMPFGTATLAVMQTTESFPEDRLDRSLTPNLKGVVRADYGRKFLRGTREILRNDLPRMGGNWISGFFLVGLLVPFRSVALSRLRWFLVASLVVLVIVQGMGTTFLSLETPEINSENLLVLLAPLAIMFGAGLFYLLVDSIKFSFPAGRLLLVTLFVFVMSAQFIYALLPPRPGPLAYPPYSPPVMQRTAGWMGERELIMSDIPWAVAWYGKRQCVWVTLNWRKEFYDITDYQKPVQALYLTQRTTDSRFLSNWVLGENHSWGNFLLESIVRKEIPSGFPLRKSPDGLFPNQLFLTDYDRWRVKGR